MSSEMRIIVRDDVRQAMEAAARAQGKTLDEVAAEAMKRYLDGQENRR